ncbi:MAG: hypothetical protein HGB14_05765 [Anaerolineaceae bacterium]|nr:hypothetical protein [Anaerolineaceae bacterium]
MTLDFFLILLIRIHPAIIDLGAIKWGFILAGWVEMVILLNDQKTIIQEYNISGEIAFKENNSHLS